MKILKRTILFFLLFALPFASKGQIEIANAMDIGFPILVNKSNAKLTYGQVMAGLRLGVSYKPVDVHFFPTLYFSFGFMRLPIKQYGENVVGANINYLNLLINQNLVFNVGERGNEIFAIGGLGFARLNPKDLYIAGPNGGAEKIKWDSTTNPGKYFPALEIGFEYVYGGAANANLYISMGVNLEYIYLLPQTNDYYARLTNTIGETTALHGSFTGNAFIPSFSLNLHYLFGKNLMFWKKKDSFYL